MFKKNEDLDLSSYHYDLPERLIAQHPADSRDNSRLLVLHSPSAAIEHKRFLDLANFIDEKDMLVVNNTRVFPARFYGQKETGGKAEVFLLEYPLRDESEKNIARTNGLIKASKRPAPGSIIAINQNLQCRILQLFEGGKTDLEIIFNPELGLAGCLNQAGQIPLPPYISRENGTTQDDVERYQTVYAHEPGAVAAPTAGLHFTDELLAKIKEQGTRIGEVTLHVGYGTFAPVREQDITRHEIHREYLTIPEATVAKVESTRKRGGRIWAVGTTSVRALEFGARKTGRLQPVNDWCDLYIYPGFQFNIVDNLITNFHLPESSLMFLVSALCGRETLLNCYAKAIEKGYRFFSYGDAMAIIGGRKR